RPAWVPARLGHLVQPRGRQRRVPLQRLQQEWLVRGPQGGAKLAVGLFSDALPSEGPRPRGVVGGGVLCGGGPPVVVRVVERADAGSQLRWNQGSPPAPRRTASGEGAVEHEVEDEAADAAPGADRESFDTSRILGERRHQGGSNERAQGAGSDSRPATRV